MAENTKIEWCDHTMNFWVGCTKVSPACDHCYAESWAKRTGHPELWAGERRRTTVENWRKPHKWNLERLGINTPRARVFTNSLADFFDNQVPEQWRADAWKTIEATPNLDWLILTKRPQNIHKMLPPGWCDGWTNVWLGTTAENQEEYDRRWPHLLAAKVLIKFVSYEPVLGDLDIGDDTPDWIICGGESGPRARDIEHVERRARHLLPQCRAAGTAFYMKQIGGKRKPFAPIPDDLMVREFPLGCV